ncbi:hypothetical protein [Actinoplanes awajinensis]|uniref:hypothetical protein n=1 Tax=Actinoplanes awajinensis TaxID=135946 RepID=UPI000AA3E507|nr:hypothetical protein [Actinoplanes awajinensis]
MSANERLRDGEENCLRDISVRAVVPAAGRFATGCTTKIKTRIVYVGHAAISSIAADRVTALVAVGSAPYLLQ